LSSCQRSNWSPTYILHLFHLEDTSLLFICLSESVNVRFLPRVNTFSFVFSFFSQSFFIFYEFMMMSMIIFGRYYLIYVILHLAQQIIVNE
jgi:hypothetical protein